MASLLFRFRQWRGTRRLKSKRRRKFKSLRTSRENFSIEQGDPAELAKIEGEQKSLDELDRALLVVEWLALRVKAARLGLFVNWSDGEASKLSEAQDGNYDPIRKEMSELRLVIRNERNERWRFWELRLKVLTAFAGALTGAIGAAIGLIAILRK